MNQDLFKQIDDIVDLHICIQGEARDCGTPAILIRISGCNMNCQFKDSVCDSAYTSWRPETGKYSLKDIEDLIHANPQIKYAFVTGGNPSFKPSLLQEIVNVLKANDLYVAIEDNGTLYSPFSGVDFVTLSPKLSNSVPKPGTIVNDPTMKDYVVTEQDRDKHEKYRTRYASMRKWIQNYDYQLKFVVSDENQLQEVKDIIKELNADKNRVYLMPEGINQQQLNSRRQWLVELCIREGFKFTDRLHIVTYGNKRES